MSPAKSSRQVATVLQQRWQIQYRYAVRLYGAIVGLSFEIARCQAIGRISRIKLRRPLAAGYFPTMYSRDRLPLLTHSLAIVGPTVWLSI